MPSTVASEVNYISRPCFCSQYLSHRQMFELLSTAGNLIHSLRFCPNVPLSSAHLPSGVTALKCLLHCYGDSMQPSVILPHTFPNVPNAYELFPQLDIKFLESQDHSLKFSVSATALYVLWSPQSLDGMLLKFSIHQKDRRESVNWEKISRKEKRSPKLWWG